jgi:hypothetical protein
MKVLSLFDGMSCGQIALKEAGIEAGRYYAAEIDKYAIAPVYRPFLIGIFGNALILSNTVCSEMGGRLM